MMLAYCYYEVDTSKVSAGMMLEKIYLLNLNSYIQHVMEHATGTH